MRPLRWAEGVSGEEGTHIQVHEWEIGVRSVSQYAHPQFLKTCACTLCSLLTGAPALEGMVNGPFYNHYPWNMPPGEDLAKAIEHTREYMAREGPFDAVMGFSQGGALAASLIINHAETHPDDEPLFRLAVFICSDRPYEATGTQYITESPGTYPISIPTVNIVGKKDYIYDLSMEVYKLCEPSLAVFFDHGEDHRIPFDRENTIGMTAAVEQGIRKAE